MGMKENENPTVYEVKSTNKYQNKKQSVLPCVERYNNNGNNHYQMSAEERAVNLALTMAEESQLSSSSYNNHDSLKMLRDVGFMFTKDDGHNAINDQYYQPINNY